MSDKFNELLYHTQAIKSYNSIDFNLDENGVITWDVEHKTKAFKCPICGKPFTSLSSDGTKSLRGINFGLSPVFIRVKMHRIKCLSCNHSSREVLDFGYSQKSRFTKFLANEALRLRAAMTITDVSKILGISWVAVKNIEKTYLSERYAEIDLSQVKNIGIDELWTGSAFLTIVRDMDSGRTLHVAEGKDSACLSDFTKQLKSNEINIENICIDMGKAYTKWAKVNYPNATVIYDKFHVIKLMNDKLSQVRRETMNELDNEEKKALKGNRFVLAKNEEDLKKSCREKLDKIRKLYNDVGETSLMKECLRRVYKICICSIDAEYALNYWSKIAVESGVKVLKTMAKTIKKKMKGIVAYFDTGLTSASMEGFNNKIGWMARNAYGYSDIEYLKLKIYDLPHLKQRLE